MKPIYQIKAVTISRVMEPAVKFESPEMALDFWNRIVAKDAVYDPEKEHLVAINVNTRHVIKAWNYVSIGSCNESIAHPREIFRGALACAAYGIILMHNHPSGDPSPSEADLRLTRRLKEGSELLQIPLLDHVIVGAPAPGHPSHYSFREAGIL